MRVYNRNIYLSSKEYLNVIEFNNSFFVLKNLSDDHGKSKGGNSSVFKLIDPNDDIEYVVKISKYPINRRDGSEFDNQQIARFEREIESLRRCVEKGCNNVIVFHFDGVLKIKSQEFRYYVMEKADYDLTTFLNENVLSVQQRFLLCFLILNGIKELHLLDIYHRDIKPDNILFANGEWKISDLGLIDYRDPDFIIDRKGEKIGPFGWLSPEAINKFLTEKNASLDFDCNLDEKSDVFQLGKLFWYVFQGNIPVGQIDYSDFKLGDQVLFDLIFKMLNHAKSKRCSLLEIESEFQKLTHDYNI